MAMTSENQPLLPKYIYLLCMYCYTCVIPMYVYTCVCVYIHRYVHFYYIHTYIYIKYLSKGGILAYLSCKRTKKEGDNKILTSYGEMIGKQDDRKPKGP